MKNSTEVIESDNDVILDVETVHTHKLTTAASSGTTPSLESDAALAQKLDEELNGKKRHREEPTVDQENGKYRKKKKLKATTSSSSNTIIPEPEKGLAIEECDYIAIRVDNAWRGATVLQLLDNGKAIFVVYDVANELEHYAFGKLNIADIEYGHYSKQAPQDDLVFVCDENNTTYTIPKHKYKVITKATKPLIFSQPAPSSSSSSSKPTITKQVEVIDLDAEIAEIEQNLQRQQAELAAKKALRAESLQKIQAIITSTYSCINKEIEIMQDIIKQSKWLKTFNTKGISQANELKNITGLRFEEHREKHPDMHPQDRKQLLVLYVNTKKEFNKLHETETSSSSNSSTMRPKSN